MTLFLQVCDISTNLLNLQNLFSLEILLLPEPESGLHESGQSSLQNLDYFTFLQSVGINAHKTNRIAPITLLSPLAIEIASSKRLLNSEACQNA